MTTKHVLFFIDFAPTTVWYVCLFCGSSNLFNVHANVFREWFSTWWLFDKTICYWLAIWIFHISTANSLRLNFPKNFRKESLGSKNLRIYSTYKEESFHHRQKLWNLLHKSTFQTLVTWDIEHVTRGCDMSHREHLIGEENGFNSEVSIFKRNANDSSLLFAVGSDFTGLQWTSNRSLASFKWLVKFYCRCFCGRFSLSLSTQRRKLNNARW